MRLPALLLLVTAGLLIAAPAPATGPDRASLVAAGLAAEVQLDAARALELFLAAENAEPADAFLLQKIARQYADLAAAQPTDEARRHYAQRALDYSLQARALAPDDPVNVISIAISHGKLALYSDTHAKVKHARLVREEAERALALAPDYALAHHVLGCWHTEVAGVGRGARLVARMFHGGLPEASLAEAIAHLERAVALEPGDPSHPIELGFAFASAGRPGDARLAWERGLALPANQIHHLSARARARAALESLR